MSLAAALLVANALLAGNDVPDTAYAQTTPVKVAACSVEGIYQMSGGDFNMYQMVGTRLRMQFSNQTTEPISSVDFIVSDGKRDAQIVDNGTFSPGVTIEHYFASPFSNVPDVTCKAATILFADGSRLELASIGAK